MSICHWPREERPRERLLAEGTAALSDAELLAVLLGSGIRGQSAVELARRLVAEFGDLRRVLVARPAELSQVSGLGPARCARLLCVMELARRSLLQQLPQRTVLASPGDTKRYFRAWLRDRKQEVFAGLFLDNRHRVIRCEALSKGTIDGASIYPREIVSRCLEIGAAAVIFAHNHPSGIAEPSDADRRITRRLRDALALIDVRVLDHLVVGDGEVVSFAERGLV
ncbi:MAG: DNA repair protein RadC [Xanthomonadales bacterium]|nr:DNA repair protein RadC [Xanthomonadales bacterium]